MALRSAEREGRGPIGTPALRDPSLDEIKALPVATIAARDCHLFFWATGPHLPQALDVMVAWGFRYSGIAFTWIKLRRNADLSELIPLGFLEARLHLGLGYTTRKNTEICLLGRRGSPKRNAKNIREVIISPVREHSRKPEEFYARVERYSGPGPRLDLFAREQRPGWTAYGDEVSKFSPEFATGLADPVAISAPARDLAREHAHRTSEGNDDEDVAVFRVSVP